MGYTQQRAEKKQKKLDKKSRARPMTLQEIVLPAQPAIQAVAKMIECGELTGSDYVALQGMLAVYSRAVKLNGKELFDTKPAIMTINRAIAGVPLSLTELRSLMGALANLVEMCKRIRVRQLWLTAQADVEFAAYLADHKWENVRDFISKQSVPFID